MVGYQVFVWIDCEVNHQRIGMMLRGFSCTPVTVSPILTLCCKLHYFDVMQTTSIHSMYSLPTIILIIWCMLCCRQSWKCLGPTSWKLLLLFDVHGFRRRLLHMRWILSWGCSATLLALGNHACTWECALRSMATLRVMHGLRRRKMQRSRYVLHPTALADFRKEKDLQTKPFLKVFWVWVTGHALSEPVYQNSCLMGCL